MSEEILAEVPEEYVHPAKKRRETVKNAEKCARARLGAEGAFVPLFVAFLFFLMLAGFALVLYWLVLSVFIRLSLPAALDTVAVIFAALVFFFTASPVFIGRMRLSGLVLLGELPRAEEVFYYFSSANRLFRAYLLTLAHLAAIFSPYLMGIGGIALSVMIFNRLLATEMEVMLAILILLLLCVLALALAVLLFVATGRLLLACGIGVGNEALTMREVLSHAWKRSRGNCLLLDTFRVRSILMIALSLLTVGVFYVLYFAHRIQITYLILCIDLKGDPQ